LLNVGYLQRVVRHEDLLEVTSSLAFDMASFPSAPLEAMKQALLSLGNTLTQVQHAKLANAIDPQEIGARIRALKRER
jgi:hypothetical protein